MMMMMLIMMMLWLCNKLYNIVNKTTSNTAGLILILFKNFRSLLLSLQSTYIDRENNLEGSIY